MPSTVRGGRNFPVPRLWGDEKFNDERLPRELETVLKNPKKPAEWSDDELRSVVVACARALDRGRERSGKFFDKAADHRALLAESLTNVGEVAFSHLTYYTALQTTTTINAVAQTNVMGVDVVVPVPSRAHVIITGCAEADVVAAGSGLLVRLQRNENGGAYATLARTEMLDATAGNVESFATQYLFADLEPAILYNFRVALQLTIAGATYLVFGRDANTFDRTNMTIRIEPRIKVF